MIKRARQWISIAIALFVLLATIPAQAQFADQMTWGGTGGGSANAQTVAISNVTALSDLLGVEVRFSPGATNTAATTLAVGGTAATAMRKWSPAGLIALSGGELRSGVPVSVMYNGTFHILLSPTMVQPLTVTNYYTAATSGTYNVGTSGGQSPRQLYVRGIGGGGGGGADSANNGVAGTNTIFGSFTAVGGGGGQAANGGGGAGGTGGAGTAFRLQGGNGSCGSGTQNSPSGGLGGTGWFGGQGAVFPGGAGAAARPGTGAGGGGGSDGSGLQGCGGGAGEGFEFTIDAPAASYSFQIGAGGAGGAAGGQAGGAGGDGNLLIREIYLRPPANDNEPMEDCRCAA